MKKGDFSLKHLPDSVVMEKLVPYLEGFNEPEAYFLEGVDSKANPEDVVSIFERRDHLERKSSDCASISWCVLDDDFEFCMLDDNLLARFASKSDVIDFSQVEHISPNGLYFIEPREVNIYHLQWNRVIESGNDQSVRFIHHGHELYSHMFPYVWRPVTGEDSTRKDLPEMLTRMGIRRFGSNSHLKRGERMTRCVMHTVCHYSERTLSLGADENLSEYRGVKYTVNS